MTYSFEAKVSGYYHIEVEANSLEEAKEKGLDAYYEADFGSLEDCETEHLCVSDENDNDFYY